MKKTFTAVVTLLLTFMLLASTALALPSTITAHYHGKTYTGTLDEVKKQAADDFGGSACDYVYLSKTKKLYNLTIHSEARQYYLDGTGEDIDATPTPEATATPKPTKKPTPKPTATATAKATPKPTKTAKATAKPTAKATTKPTAKATAKATATVKPTATLAATPTLSPTATQVVTATPTASSSFYLPIPTCSVCPTDAPDAALTSPGASGDPAVTAKPCNTCPFKRAAAAISNFFKGIWGWFTGLFD